VFVQAIYGSIWNFEGAVMQRRWLFESEQLGTVNDKLER